MSVEQAIMNVAEGLEDFSARQMGISKAFSFVLAQILAQQCFDADDPLANAQAGREELLRRTIRFRPDAPEPEVILRKIEAAYMGTIREIGDQVVSLVEQELQRS